MPPVPPPLESAPVLENLHRNVAVQEFAPGIAIRVDTDSSEVFFECSSKRLAYN